MKMDLKAKPFNLDDSQIEWVNKTLGSMSLEDKLGQLFLFMAMGDVDEFTASLDKIGLRPSGFLLRGAPAKVIRGKIQKLQDHYDIPLLIAGDLDRGASNMIEDGTCCGHQMEICATGDPDLAYRTGYQTAKECAAVGANWDFGPVTDIDYNPFNPIINVRSFSSDPEKVRIFTQAIAKGMHDGGLIPCMKHWPGDGCDFRDQHFLASINDKSVDEWDRTYGRIYKTLIDDGVETLMTAHILQPAYTRFFDPDVKDEEMLPGSLNYDLHHKLLREKLGFNGLIITDATSMGGFTEVVPRSKAVPLSIANGADIFLFSRDIEEDFNYMKEGLKNGILTEERIDEAVKRTLALKAKINLHIKKANGTLVPPPEALEIFTNKEGQKLAEEIADKGITLVKDTQNLIPFTAEEKKNIYMVVMGDKPGYHNAYGGYAKYFKQKLEEKGFNVMTFDPDNPAEPLNYGKGKIEDLKKKIDVVIYFANLETSGADSGCRISWPGLRATIPSMNHDIPTMLISIDNPYLLMDAPRMSTYINAYTSDNLTIDTLVDKITGKSEFKGVSPIDPFVGLFNAKY
jgi:beta-N-acetylhexosaminidase